ncbi:MAG TPA: hypothetical protein VG944_04510 [Fimbriimonas sp.]|nr:hypothetical protein [Fimbriimonas sp.]
MTLILAALLGARPPHTDAFGRYRAFMAAHQSFQVSFSTKLNGHDLSTGSITVQRPQRLLFRARGGRANYSISSTEAGYVEIERGTKTYEELPSLHRLATYPSEISGMAYSTLPTPLLFPDLRTIFDRTTDVTSSAAGDRLHISARTMMGKMDAWADVDSKGRLTYFRKKTVPTRGGGADYEWHFKPFTFPANLKLKDFLTTLPVGFVPYALPRMEMPLQIGKPAPTNGWTTPNGRQTVDLAAVAGHKPFIFAVLDTDSAASLGALAFLKTIQDGTPVFWTGNGGYTDRSGRLLALLNPPATPMFYLIDGQGKVAKLWLGFDSSHRAAFQAEVLKAVQEASSSKKP